MPDDATQLSDRSREVLYQTVQTFISTGEPVGSKILSRMNSNGFSSATIRNIMANLEQTGFLFQPHTSSGRIPTDRGYRFYVSSLIEAGSLLPTNRQWIQNQLIPNEDGLEGLVQRTTRLLASTTGMVGFVTGPDVRKGVLQHVDFVRMGPRRLLVVLVSEAGHVSNRVVDLPREIPHHMLIQCARYLEEQFAGLTLSEAQQHLLDRLKEIRLAVNDFVCSALLIADVAFAGDLHSEVHIDGASRVLSEPEFIKNIHQAHKLLATLEQRHQLLEILSICLEDSGLRIVIGSEAPVPDFEGLSLIGARYDNGNQILGSVGIMGPTRMEYARHIPTVDQIARSMSAVIAQTRRELTN